jgi:[acyl-carrier-protein] S-malonyltransferase
MADAWISHAASKAVLDEASSTMGIDLVERSREAEALAATDFVQPALLTIDVAAFRVLEAEGVSFGGAAGHSLGEFAALVAAGVLRFSDALEIVRIRGQAMQAAGAERPGTMTALLGVGADQAAEWCDLAREDGVLLVANENSPRQVVLSGSFAAIERAEAIAAERRVRTVRLKVAGAFHSPLMEPAVGPLAEAIDAVEFGPSRFPVAANVSGALLEDAGELRDLLKRHVVSAVRWQRCAEALARAGTDVFVEAGPGDVLTKLAKRVVPDARALAVGSPAAVASLAAELG